MEIAAPIEYVFEFDSNPKNWTKTMPALRDLEIVEETEERVRMTAVYEMLGQSIDIEEELTIVEPTEHYRVTVEGEGGLRRNQQPLRGDREWDSHQPQCRFRVR